MIEQRKIFLDRQLADAIGTDRFGRRGLRRGYLLRLAINHAARGYEDDPPDATVAAKLQQFNRRNNVVLDICHHIEIGSLWHCRMDQMEHDIKRLDGRRD